MVVIVVDDVDWDSANCLSVGAEMFFPDRGRDPYEVRKKVCSRCPVKQACLDKALDGEERYGIWGGTTGLERLRILRVRKGDPKWWWPRGEYMMPTCRMGHDLAEDVDHRGYKSCSICRQPKAG